MGVFVLLERGVYFDDVGGVFSFIGGLIIVFDRSVVYDLLLLDEFLQFGVDFECQNEIVDGGCLVILERDGVEMIDCLVVYFVKLYGDGVL